MTEAMTDQEKFDHAVILIGQHGVISQIEPAIINLFLNTRIYKILEVRWGDGIDDTLILSPNNMTPLPNIVMSVYQRAIQITGGLQIGMDVALINGTINLIMHNFNTANFQRCWIVPDKISIDEHRNLRYGFRLICNSYGTTQIQKLPLWSDRQLDQISVPMTEAPIWAAEIAQFIDLKFRLCWLFARLENRRQLLYWPEDKFRLLIPEYTSDLYSPQHTVVGDNMPPGSPSMLTFKLDMSDSLPRVSVIFLPTRYHRDLIERFIGNLANVPPEEPTQPMASPFF